MIPANINAWKPFGTACGLPVLLWGGLSGQRVSGTEIVRVAMWCGTSQVDNFDFVLKDVFFPSFVDAPNSRVNDGHMHGVGKLRFVEAIRAMSLRNEASMMATQAKWGFSVLVLSEADY